MINPDSPEPEQVVGGMLRHYREEQGLTTKDMAEKSELGFTEQDILAIESGNFSVLWNMAMTESRQPRIFSDIDDLVKALLDEFPI